MSERRHHTARCGRPRPRPRFPHGERPERAAGEPHRPRRRTCCRRSPRQTNGLTVVRCEESRHSFLKPLADTGADVFLGVAGHRRGAARGDPLGGLPRASDRRSGRRAAAAASSPSGWRSRCRRRARDEHLYRQAHYDPLTALPNRLLFRDRLAQELANAAAGLSRGALLYIDLDHFKRVNDSVGHTAGRPAADHRGAAPALMHQGRRHGRAPGRR